MGTRLQLHPDRLFPADPSTRSIARQLYQSVASLPILSPHGHVPIDWLVSDRPWVDPLELLISPDHYITRLLHASGVALERLGVPPGQALSADDARAGWRLFCEHWPVFRGTPMKYWMEQVLVEVFEIDQAPSRETADQLFDQIAQRLARPDRRPRALMDRFNIEFLATTDDPLDALQGHDQLASDPGFNHRVAPTFRPDRLLNVTDPGWPQTLVDLSASTGVDALHWNGWLAAVAARRWFFKEHGGVSTDHGLVDASTEPVDQATAQRLFNKARHGQIEQGEATALAATMLFEQARMACDDGLTMTLHPGVLRDHHAASAARLGKDIGADIPTSVEFTRALRPMLNAFGTHPNFQLVLFTIDESTYSRELAPLAGFYPSVYLGAPWWFIDAPEAIGRFKRAVTESAGFSRLAGFVDDTRAFLSIPSRHDMARRLDAAHLAQLVAEHRLTIDEASEVIGQLVSANPRKVFRISASAS
ncbi:MAG: glucuronate isomerase [Propionibacteriaceae bacterium]|nr:glucuronate isomerase [Propionibacteriaceae bacterium]